VQNPFDCVDFARLIVYSLLHLFCRWTVSSALSFSSFLYIRDVMHVGFASAMASDYSVN
jgi:hypothetical protein